MFCVNCGEKIDCGHRYCTNCGYENRNYHNKTGYLKKHWKGELPLKVSFWINNIFLYGVFFILLLIAMLNIDIVSKYLSTNNTILMFVEIVLYWLFVYTFLAWSLVGLWRSSSNYIKIHNKLLWAYMTKILVVIMLVAFVIPLLMSSIVQLMDFAKLTMAKENKPSYKIEMHNKHKVIEITGGIRFGLANKVKDYFRKYPNINTVILNSSGGSTYEARILSKFLIGKNITTFTTKACSSACVDIFMAGEQRILYRKASLGFHQASYPMLTNMPKNILTLSINRQRKHYLNRGVKIDFVEKAFTTPNDDMWHPSHLELIQAGVVDKVVDYIPVK